MGIDSNLTTPHGQAALYDNTTDQPLPMELFASEDAARHFLLWAEREGREPFGPSKNYDHRQLMEAQMDWADKYVDGGSGDLTDEAYAELEDAD